MIRLVDPRGVPENAQVEIHSTVLSICRRRNASAAKVIAVADYRFEFDFNDRLVDPDGARLHVVYLECLFGVYLRAGLPSVTKHTRLEWAGQSSHPAQGAQS